MLYKKQRYTNMEETSWHFLGFIGVILLAACIFDDATIGFFLFISLCFVVLSYKKHGNKKHKEEVLQREIKETSTFKVMAHHKNLGFGYLGTTANYLFFVPDKNEKRQLSSI
ncbi:hypothetical protein CN907_01590 [Bacillus anthracis]|nr:hypothetical protein CN907_01590 [Bacillus anthracis]